MRKHLNTLYVTTQGAYLAKDGESILVRVEGRPKARVPAHNLAGIVCFGNVSFSPFLLGHCSERGILVSFLTQRGRFLARIHGKVSGNVLLRREQYRRADDEDACAAIARNVVVAKSANCRLSLLRARRDRPDSPGGPAVEAAAAELSRCLRQVQRERSVESIRGVEGAAARAYFGVFRYLITQQVDSFAFTGRSRRPPLDRINALLSFVYTLLVHDVTSALEGVGLDPAVGFLHRDRPGRPSLALDMMEELRPYVADRLSLALVNLRTLNPDHFNVEESGAVLLTEDGRMVVLRAYQKRKDEELTHPFLGEKVTVGMLPHLQALLLARHLRGDLDAYPPFLAR